MDPTHAIILPLHHARSRVIELHSSTADDAMPYIGFDSSSEDIEVISPILMSPRLELHESQVPPEVDWVDLMLEDYREDLEKDTPFEEDLSMNKEDSVMKLECMEEDSSQDSSKKSF